MNTKELLYWTPRGLALFLTFFWLIVLFLYDFGSFTVAAMMIWFLLFLTLLLAWKNAPLGGNFYLLLGFLYLFFLNPSFSFFALLSASPFLITGFLFLLSYLLLNKTKQRKKRK